MSDKSIKIDLERARQQAESSYASERRALDLAMNRSRLVQRRRNLVRCNIELGHLRIGNVAWLNAFNA